MVRRASSAILVRTPLRSVSLSLIRPSSPNASEGSRGCCCIVGVIPAGRGPRGQDAAAARGGGPRSRAAARNGTLVRLRDPRRLLDAGSLTLKRQPQAFTLTRPGYGFVLLGSVPAR